MSQATRIWLDPESWIDYFEDYLDSISADNLLDFCLRNVDWEDRSDSRLLAWYGAFDYQYPGVSHSAREMLPELAELCTRVAEDYRTEAPLGFDGIRLNKYSSGDAFVDFHADDEPSLAREYPIAFVSLGHSRTLLFRSTARSVLPGYAFTLPHASMLVTGGLTQNRWHHGVPVEPQCTGLRVSLTLRKGNQSNHIGEVPER